MQIFQYFFDNFFVLSQWPLVFYISNINTSLYRFLLKFFNFGIYTSLVATIPRKCYQGRSQVFIGGGQAGGNVKFINKTLLQNIKPRKFVL